jgi:hypothetical protein
METIPTDNLQELNKNLASLNKNLKSMRLVFGVSIILMALVLMYCLPAVVENSTFRAYRIAATQNSQSASGQDDMGGMDMDGMDMGSSSAGMAATDTPNTP